MGINKSAFVKSSSKSLRKKLLACQIQNYEHFGEKKRAGHGLLNGQMKLNLTHQI